jgi:hypothetical protein
MDMQFWTIIFFLVLISTLLIIVLALGFYIVFNKKRLETSSDQTLNSTTNQTKDYKNIKRNLGHVITDEQPVQNCHIHDDVHAEAFCSICKDALCENCIREDENVYFCSEHFQLYLRSEWIELDTVTTTPNNPEDGMYIYKFQEMIWKDNQTPTFITTHYKIDIEKDHIESEVKLMAREEEKADLKGKLNPVKNQ